MTLALRIAVKRLCLYFQAHQVVVLVGIKPLKARHDVTKLNLTVLLLSFWCMTLI